MSIAEQRAVGFIPAWSLAFLQASYLKREKEEPVLIKTKPDQPILVTSHQIQASAVKKSDRQVTRITKPSKCIQQLLHGKETASNQPSDLIISKEVQIAQSPIISEKEKVAEQMMFTDYLDKYALATEISNVEALEPQFLKEAKSQPNWSQ